MSKLFLAIICTLMYISLFYLSSVDSIIQHEEDHEKIDRYHGCKEVEIEYENLWLSGKTFPSDCNQELDMQRREMNSINEIVTSNFSNLKNSIITIAFIITLIWIIK